MTATATLHMVLPRQGVIRPPYAAGLIRPPYAAAGVDTTALPAAAAARISTEIQAARARCSHHGLPLHCWYFPPNVSESCTKVSMPFDAFKAQTPVAWPGLLLDAQSKNKLACCAPPGGGLGRSQSAAGPRRGATLALSCVFVRRGTLAPPVAALRTMCSSWTLPRTPAKRMPSMSTCCSRTRIASSATRARNRWSTNSLVMCRGGRATAVTLYLSMPRRALWRWVSNTTRMEARMSDHQAWIRRS